MSFGRQVRTVIRLDAAELVRSRWLVFCAASYLVLAVVFVLVGLRESTVLGYTGTGRVLLSLCHGALFVLPLLALAAFAPVVGRAREEGAFEVLFGLPLGRGAWLVGVTITRLVALIAPLCVLMIGVAVYGRVVHGQAVPWGFLVRMLAISSALIVAFAGIGLAISAAVRTQTRVIVYMLLAWALGVALLDVGLIGAMLRWRLDPHAVFLLAALNPVEDARLALLSGLDPDLASLGPVGFYLANRIGTTALFVLGIAWPLLVGIGAWTAALITFRRSDAS